MNEKIKILILGGGFGGIYTLKYLHNFFHQNKKVKLILVNKKNYFLFTPLLHEVATGSVSLENTIEALREIIKCCDWDFIHGEVKKIDLENKEVFIDDFKLNYDYLVIALGSTTNFYNIPGAEENSFTLKSIDDAIKLKNHFIHSFEKASLNYQEGDLNFVIVGGGATGVELAAEMSDYFYGTFNKLYSKELIEKVRIFLIERGTDLIPQFSLKLRELAKKTLIKKKVEILLNKGVIEVGKDFVKLDDGTIIKSKTIIWVAGVKPNLPEIVGKIEKDNKGRLIVNEYLQVKNYSNVFAVGDVCCLVQNEKPLPQLAQVATKEAKYVAWNIKNLIENKNLKKFVYQHTGDLISLGRFYAIGEIGRFTFSGFFTWILWRGVYLCKMVSFRDQLKTIVDWFTNLFLPRDISEI
ncbi:MAG: hypothetical protein C4348_00650 [Patescibacteria group bacterium]